MNDANTVPQENSAPLDREAAAPVLSIENLVVSLPSWADRQDAVSDVSLTIRPNEMLCVVGESGSGKSVMSKAILRLLPEPHVRVTSGRILFEGRDLLELSDKEIRDIRGSKIAMIFQEPMTALNPLMTVGRQLGEVLEAHTSLTRVERLERVIELFENMHLPDAAKLVRSYPHELSGGQRQRVMIAMALALEPKLIIADEPTTALDVTTQAQILALLKDIQLRHGTSVLFITHDFGVVAEIADRVVVMRHGKVVEEGAATDILTHPGESYTRELVDAVPSLKPRQLPATCETSPVLEVRDLVKSFVGRSSLFAARARSVKAVADVSLSVAKGQSLAVVGESGSGKSTLARCIVGIEKADSGQILVDGTNIANLSRAALRPWRRIVQMVFQDPFASLNPRQRVGDMISLGPIIQGMPKDEAWEEARELLRLCGLDPKAVDRFPHEFSGGQRQRIGIARALAVKPKLIIADEPVSALDVSVQKQVLELLDHLRSTLDLSMLFITHDLRVAAHVCDEVVVMQRGKLVERGRTADIFSNPKHDYTRALLDSVPGRDWVR